MQNHGKGYPGSLAITSFTFGVVVRLEVQWISQTTCRSRHPLEAPSTAENSFECSLCRLSAQARSSQTFDRCRNGSRSGSAVGSANSSSVFSFWASQRWSPEGDRPGVSWSSEGKPRSRTSVGRVVVQSGRLSTGVRSVTSEDHRPLHEKAPSWCGRWSTRQVGLNKQHCVVPSVRSRSGISRCHPCSGSRERLPHRGQHSAIQSMASLWQRADDRLPSRAPSEGLGYSSQNCSKSQRHSSIGELDQDMGSDHGRCSWRVFSGTFRIRRRSHSCTWPRGLDTYAEVWSGSEKQSQRMR